MEFNVRDVLRLLAKRAWAIVAFMVVCGVGAGWYTERFEAPVYEASTKVIVNKVRDNQGVPELNVNDLNANMHLIATYKEIIKTPWIMDEIVAEHPEFNLEMAQLTDAITVSSVNDTQVITLSALASSHVLAANVVNAVTEKFKQKIPLLMRIDNVEILTRANPADHAPQVRPNATLNILIATLVAAMIAIGVVFIIETFDDSVKGDDDTEHLLGLPLLAVIGKMKRADYRPRRTGDKKNAKSPEVANLHAVPGSAETKGEHQHAATPR